MARSALDELREEARRCTACPLYRDATQTVFGEGFKKARLMFVGEQPGDREDREGRPFVKVERRGERRIHQRPGAVAAQALLGRKFKVTQHRGELMATEFAPVTIATVHPPSILRAPDDVRQSELVAFVDDLKVVGGALKRGS